jgi:hypothetical protein
VRFYGNSSCDSVIEIHGYGTTYTFREIKSLLGSLLLQDHDSLDSLPLSSELPWSNLHRLRLPLRSLSYRQRFDVKLKSHYVKLKSFNNKATSSFSYELVLLRTRSHDPPSQTPKNSMARPTSSIPGSLQLRLSYESIARLLATPRLNSTTFTLISNHTFKLWFSLSSPKLKTIKPRPIPRFSINSLAFTRIRTRYRKQRTSYTLSSKVLNRFTRSLLSSSVSSMRHVDKTRTTSTRLQLSVKGSIPRSRVG